MVSLQLYSRGESKKYLNLVFNQITNQQYNDARSTALQLKNCLLKYYLTRGVDCTNIHDTFHEFDFLLRMGGGSTKQNTCFDFIKKIRGMSQLAVQDPIEQLRHLYGDIRYAYLHLSKKNVDNILDCFDEIRELQPRLQKIGGSTFNYYAFMLKRMADCEGALVAVSTQNVNIPSKETLSELSSTFKKFFSSIQPIVAAPIRLDIKPEDIQRFLKEGTSLAEVSKASGRQEEELRDMLERVEAQERDSQKSPVTA